MTDIAPHLTSSASSSAAAGGERADAVSSAASPPISAHPLPAFRFSEAPVTRGTRDRPRAAATAPPMSRAPTPAPPSSAKPNRARGGEGGRRRGRDRARRWRGVRGRARRADEARQGVRAPAADHGLASNVGIPRTGQPTGPAGAAWAGTGRQRGPGRRAPAAAGRAGCRRQRCVWAGSLLPTPTLHNGAGLARCGGAPTSRAPRPFHPAPPPATPNTMALPRGARLPCASPPEAGVLALSQPARGGGTVGWCLFCFVWFFFFSRSAAGGRGRRQPGGVAALGLGRHNAGRLMAGGAGSARVRGRTRAQTAHARRPGPCGHRPPHASSLSFSAPMEWS